MSPRTLTLGSPKTPRIRGAVISDERVSFFPRDTACLRPAFNPPHGDCDVRLFSPCDPSFLELTKPNKIK
jgi:hypothetical protein